MFKFLKLRNSVSGDARRHVPFTSIIHKPIFIIFVLVFSFVSVVPVKVKALADPVPQFNVINGTDLDTFIGGYNAATSDIQWITNALLGAQVLEYGGLGDYKISFEQLPDDADVWDKIVLIGERFTDELMLPYVAADRYFSKIIDYAQGALNFARSFGSRVSFLAHVNNVQNFFIEYDSEFGSEINQYFAVQGGLFNWNNWSSGYTPPVPNFKLENPSGVYLTDYQNKLSQLSTPRVFCTSSYADTYNAVCEYSGEKYILFINTSNRTISYHNAINYYCKAVDCVKRYDNSMPSYLNNDAYVTFDSYTYSSGVSNYTDALNDFFTYGHSPSIYMNGLYDGYRYQHYLYPDAREFIEDIYIGTSFNNAVKFTMDYDLGFSQTDSLQVLNPNPNTALLYDLKALVEQIVAAQPDPNYELPLQPIIYNVTQVNGDPLTAEDLEGLSFNVTPTESGIDLPVDVFAPLFDQGKGFISYMWYMTKPLVMYTRSFLDAITFDPVEGFNASGPGYFILGVAAIGLIGGVVVKFLL